jgi:hypothetical protein
LNSNRTVQQLCDAIPGAFFCPGNKVFCGYQRDDGRLTGGELKPICLPLDSALAGRCASVDVKPLPKNFTFGLPNAAISVQTIEGARPDGTAGRPVAKFGVDRGNLASNISVFFTGDGSKTDVVVSFSVQCF